MNAHIKAPYQNSVWRGRQRTLPVATDCRVLAPGAGRPEAG
jgi:hypothetical protein